MYLTSLMVSPFPGMDPYLEHPSLWPEVHHRLISAIANALENDLSLDYRVAIEKRVYFSTPETPILVGIPDVSISETSRISTTTMIRPVESSQSMIITLPMSEEVKESYLEIREIATGEVITAIEVLAPTNKRTGNGRDAYNIKRQAVLDSKTHLVEIDLLRSGAAMDVLETLPISDYRIIVSRSPDRPQAQLYAFDLDQLIPIITIPLRSIAEDIPLNLQTLLNQIYKQARYAITIDYATPPVPPLRPNLQSWAVDQMQNSFDS